MSGTNKTLGRSAGPEDVKPGWLLESAVRSVGPYVNYPDGTVMDRRTQEILWRPGDDPAKRPENPPVGKMKNPRYTVRRGL